MHVSLTGLAFVVAAALYTGFQWTIRVLVYPQFATVAGEGFAAYEARHQKLVSVAVGPLFAVLVVTAGAVVVRPPAGAPGWAPYVAALLVVAVLLLTGLLAVPLHRRLSTGFDAAAHRRLLGVDTARLVAAAGATACGVVALLG